MYFQSALYAIDFLEGLRYSDIIGVFFWGATSVLMCFIFFLFIKAKEYIYIYYTLFLFFILIYCLTHLVAFPGINARLLDMFRGNGALTESMVLISFAFYVLFAIHLLEITKQNKKLSRFLYALAISSLGYSVLYLLTFTFLAPIERYLFIATRLILFPLSIFTIIWIYSSVYSPVKFYFITGSIAYLLGSVIASLRFIGIPLPFHLMANLTSTAYFELGILLQALFFAMALGQRIVLLHEQKLASDQALIKQLQKNHRITLDTNKALEIEVQHRVSELIQVKEDLQEQEKKRLEIEYRNNLMHSEIRAKQAQVNPHFIYNSMNALKYMIQQNHNRKAISYLVRFSRMVRTILEKIEEDTIPLTKEIEYIQNYLELEKERFIGFNYSIEIEEGLQINEIPIPPLLLQPLVEYTIWQYLSSDDYSLKKMRILIAKKENNITISIYNDGIIKIENSKTENNEGICLAEERIELFNKQSSAYHLELCFHDTTKEGGTRNCANLTLIYQIKEEIH